jgi:ribosomal protein L29
MSKHVLEMPRINDIGQMSNEELKNNLVALRGTNMTDRGNVSRGAIPPVGRPRQTRVTIARILTIAQKRGIRL